MTMKENNVLIQRTSFLFTVALQISRDSTQNVCRTSFTIEEGGVPELGFAGSLRIYWS